MQAYKLWHEFLPHFPKTSRYTLAARIDGLFIDMTELLLMASYLAREQKLSVVQKAATKLDVLKFFLQVAWEIKALDSRRYIALSERVGEVGKMLGGWAKRLKETSA